ncbi:MAG: hypothetical protein A3K18_09835 [Lentisphaerae bacterium RIFOXYA12_64_32]|nr:MAG: hypothetical protein A3K18_09835 [Lentisphaerae bacterium RIFOXYA12_64_32]
MADKFGPDSLIPSLEQAQSEFFHYRVEACGHRWHLSVGLIQPLSQSLVCWALFPTSMQGLVLQISFQPCRPIPLGPDTFPPTFAAGGWQCGGAYRDGKGLEYMTADDDGDLVLVTYRVHPREMDAFIKPELLAWWRATLGTDGPAEQASGADPRTSGGTP